MPYISLEPTKKEPISFISPLTVKSFICIPPDFQKQLKYSLQES